MQIQPYVIENTPRGEREYNIFSRLLKDRQVFLGSAIDDVVANSIIAQFLFLEVDNPEKDIHLYINSPGGSVSSGLAIYDIMQFVKCDVATYCVGSAASMAALLLAAGAKGKRYSMPHSRMMIHQPLVHGGLGGQASDIAIHAKELMQLKEQLTRMYGVHMSRTYEELSAVMERNKYMSAMEAKEFGMIDHIVESRKAKTK